MTALDKRHFHWRGHDGVYPHLGGEFLGSLCPAAGGVIAKLPGAGDAECDSLQSHSHLAADGENPPDSKKYWTLPKADVSRKNLKEVYVFHIFPRRVEMIMDIAHQQTFLDPHLAFGSKVLGIIAQNQYCQTIKRVRKRSCEIMFLKKMICCGLVYLKTSNKYPTLGVLLWQPLLFRPPRGWVPQVQVHRCGVPTPLGCSWQRRWTLSWKKYEHEIWEWCFFCSQSLPVPANLAGKSG